VLLAEPALELPQNVSWWLDAISNREACDERRLLGARVEEPAPRLDRGDASSRWMRCAPPLEMGSPS
jgi:hypothetical protein